MSLTFKDDCVLNFNAMSKPLKTTFKQLDHPPLDDASLASYAPQFNLSFVSVGEIAHKQTITSAAACHCDRKLWL